MAEEKPMHEILAAMDENQKRRFGKVIRTVYRRVLRNTSSSVKAATYAFSMAFGAAVRAVSPEKLASAEEELHYFTPMFPEQAGRSANSPKVEVSLLSFDFMQKNIDLVRVAAVGNAFNLDHDKSKQAGIVRDILLPKDVPKNVKFDQDAPFVMVASYFKDTPKEVRVEEKISGEWLEFKEENGMVEAVPMAFAVTDSPLNSDISGVKKVASKGVQRIISQGRASSDTGTKMPETIAVEDRVASLTNELEASRKTITAKETEITALREKAASADTLKVRVSELEAGVLKAAAEKFASDLVRGKKIKTDSKEKWAAAYIRDSGLAEALAEALPTSTLGEHDATAHGKEASIDNEQIVEMRKAASAFLKRGGA